MDGFAGTGGMDPSPPRVKFSHRRKEKRRRKSRKGEPLKLWSETTDRDIIKYSTCMPTYSVIRSALFFCKRNKKDRQGLTQT